ncbi:MAG: AI-2E family transporter [Actinomycetota bacterium]|nr:AI-2E family transporter [Actinomycetota bacterium]
MPTPKEINPLYRAVMLAAGLLVLGLLFRELLTLLVAILITVILAIPLALAADKLEARGVPRFFGALAALLGGVAVIAAIMALVIPPFVEQTQEFVDSVPGTLEDLEGQVADTLGISPSEVGDNVQGFLQKYTEDPGSLVGPLAQVGLSVVGILGALIFMVLTAFYIALNPQPLVNGLLSLFPPGRREAAGHLTLRLRTAWVGWLQGVLIDMLVTGVLLYLGLTLIGLDFAIFFAVFSALLVVIPYFGAVIGAVPVFLFALADSPTTAFLALGVYVVVQQIEGNLIIPLVMAQRVNLHPALIAIGVILVGQLFGFIGLFVAVPILSAVVILVDEFWVKPIEEERGVTTVAEREVPALLTAEGLPHPPTTPQPDPVA